MVSGRNRSLCPKQWLLIRELCIQFNRIGRQLLYSNLLVRKLERDDRGRFGARAVIAKFTFRWGGFSIGLFAGAAFGRSQILRVPCLSFPRYSWGCRGWVDEGMANISVARMAKSPLGRGLGALLGGTSGVSPGTAPLSSPVVRSEDGEKILQLSVVDVLPSPFQPRRVFAEENLSELVDSIRARGIFQPLIVRRSPKGNGYELIAGERRWRAAKKLNLPKVPVIVREATDQQVLELALIENLQRAELDPVEEADGYATLIETFGLKQEEVAERVGKNRATVANSLRLRSLPQEVRDLLRSRQLSVGHAKAILGLGEVAAQTAIGREVVKRGLSVRQAEALVRRQTNGTRGRKKGRGLQSADWRDLEIKLQRATGTRAKIVGSAGKGHIELPYTSPEELERLSVHLGVRPAL